MGDPYFIGTAASPTQIADSGPNVVEGRELNSPLGVALDTSVSPPIVYIADSFNNRVLGFQYSTQLVPGALADVIIGQTDRFSNLSSQQNGRSASGLTAPSGLAVDSAGNLYVSDTGNNRILRFPKPFAASFSGFPDLVLGQTTNVGRTANAGGLSATSLALSSGNTFRSGLAFDSAGNLWVADTANNRVLRYPAAALSKGLNGPAADVVIGQADFVSAVPATTRISKTALTLPQGVAFDSGGRLLVTDFNSRVLVYAASPGSNAVASRILGIDTSPATPPTATAVRSPSAVVGTAAGVFVADTGNNRLLSYQTVDNWTAETPQQFSPVALAVTGQPSFTVAKANQGNADASASSFNFPVDLASSGSELFVADTQNNRVLVFALSPSGLAAAATRVIGQLDFPYNAPNLIEGKEFGLNQQGSAILDQSATPAHLYVADTQNNRILGFSDFSHLKNGQQADIVIGQPDFKRSQINYPTNDPAQPSAGGLHSPSTLAVDSAGNLYVADTGNSRVLRFPAPFASGKTSGENADLVIGQQSFTSLVTDPTAFTMSAPFGIALTADAANSSVTSSGWLVVSDNAHHRVLFFQKPFASGMSATKVLGAPNFVNPGGSSAPQRFISPRGVAVDPQDRVMVADTGNHRVQIFNRAADINTFDTPPVSLVSGLNQPVSITSNANGFWVADLAQSAISHFPIFDQLGIKNNASDAVQPAVGPISVFVDSFNNLLVTDSANRVDYFAPEVKVVSAANYSSRATTAGSIASAYPATTSSATPNVIAADTASNSGFPIATTLADTQILINGAPTPMFYASPSQINLVLPNGLSRGGTADLQIVRQSTGQIYGGAELQLASADPALFTANTSGSGQVSAINVVDNTVNSPGNPVARGQFISLFGTGVGPVPNAPADGQPATGLTPATDLPQIVLGSSASPSFLPSSNITYSGLAPTLVGVWQINVLIPADATTGSSVPIRVFQNSIVNIDLNSATSGTSGSTTIAIK